MFALLGGMYFYWPKLFGKLLDERLGKAHFWLLFIGFNMTFLVQHQLGVAGHEEVGDLERVLVDLVVGLGPVREAAGVTEVDHRLARQDELDRHRDSLVNLKYLTERTIRLTNAPAQVVILRAYRKAQTLIPKVRMQFTNFSAYDPNGIVVIVTALAEDMPALEKVVRESDTP